MTHANFTTSGVTLTDPQVARIREEIENTRFRSAWDNGVKLYALDILGDYSKMLDYAKETGRDSHPNTGTGFADMDKDRVRQLLALWAVVLAGMAAFAAVVLLHLQNNAF